ncbi:hypothetical protein [Streptomyces sp. cg35]|uniref:hypothetical protein n=1 Tax=Streptomyces sp. cg35 TaxID=3421650 RepID=UPI003D16290F
MMSRPRTTANRLTLGTVALIVLCAGVWLASFDERWAAHLPAGRPAPPADSVLLDRDGLAELRTHAWWTPTVMAVGILAAVALIVCFLSQVTVRRPARLTLAAPGSHVRGSGLEDAIRLRTQSVDGVARCHVRIARRRRRLHVQQHVWLEPGITPSSVLGALNTVVDEARTAAAPRPVTVQVRLRGTHHRTPHVH